MEFVDVLLRHLNLSYILIPLSGDEENYGTKLPNGSWTSYLNALQKHEVDFIIGNFGQLSERLEDFEFVSTVV